MTSDTISAPAPAPFRHEALLYAGTAEFVDRTATFLQEGIVAGEPAFVVVSATKIALLRDALGPDMPGVEFADMVDIGRNPARIIPAWRSFVDRHRGEPGLRGVGEPVWSGRSPAELVECQRHESLLNLALADADGLWLICPYDLATLDHDVVDGAWHSHPYVSRRGRTRASTDYPGPDALPSPFDGSLPDPPVAPAQVEFGVGGLSPVRDLVERAATDHGLDRDRVADLVLAVSELGANSLSHGGGHGRLRIWSDRSDFVCEISDAGHIEDPLAGRREPVPDAVGGRGLWIANQVCDLVEVRSTEEGSVVRVRLCRPSAPA
jgi:anti-sigma regulatory factor (Ser/Thr protein kinase)